MNVDTFWMVWNPQSRAPTLKHSTEESANAEADRLARKVPGERFYVLQAKRFVEKSDLVRVELQPVSDDDIPF